MPAVDLAIFLATSGHSGVDRVFRNLIPAIAQAGCRVDLLGIAGHGPFLDDLPAGVRRLELGARHVTSALPALTRYLRRERPTVLLTDKDRVNRLALVARALSRASTRLAFRQGTMVSVNVASRGWPDRWLQTLSIRHLYRLADHLLVPSRDAARDLAAFARVPRERVAVVPSPIVTPALYREADLPPPHPWLDAEVPVVLGVGELSGRKDFATLLRAFAQVRARRPCRLLILGEGRRRGPLLALAKELGIVDEVALPGFVANPYPAMKRAAAFALTSLWEGMPVVLIEALALGLPVVASDCPGGTREVLGDGRYGRLVPMRDDAALAEALIDLLDRPPASDRLREAVGPYTVEASARAYRLALGLEQQA